MKKRMTITQFSTTQVARQSSVYKIKPIFFLSINIQKISKLSRILKSMTSLLFFERKIVALKFLILSQFFILPSFFEINQIFRNGKKHKMFYSISHKGDLKCGNSIIIRNFIKNHIIEHNPFNFPFLRSLSRCLKNERFFKLKNAKQLIIKLKNKNQIIQIRGTMYKVSPKNNFKII